MPLLPTLVNQSTLLVMKHKTKLQLPFTGQWFTNNGGDTIELNHHHRAKAQKYAFDFVILKNGKHHRNAGKKNSDHYIFGQPILSPADGSVVEAVDGVRDNNPGEGNYLSAAGNHLIIKHQANEHSFMAHFKQDSICVKRGDKVKAGQLLGKVGNSGQSYSPHFHYHLQDSNTLLTYKTVFKNSDETKGSFPHKIQFTEVAKGIMVYFSDVAVEKNGKVAQKKLYSPIRGDHISPT